MNKLLFICLLSLSFFSVGQTTTYQIHGGNLFNISFYEEKNLGTEEHEGAGYFSYHYIRNVLEDNPALYTPPFTAGVIDRGFYQNHEDFDNFLLNLNPGSKDYHGTATYGSSFGSIPGNKKGTLAISKPYTILKDASLRPYYNNFKILASFNVRIINASVFHYIEGENNIEGGNNIDSLIDLIKLYKPFRDEIKSNPDILYIFSAGNDGLDAIHGNGILHYTYSEPENKIVYNELTNVIIVGAIGYDNNLHYYSNFGKSVDIATISGIFAPMSINGFNLSTYHDTVKYGIHRFQYDVSGNLIGGGIDGGNFSGTSASAPIASGMASLLLAMDPSMSGEELKNALIGEYPNNLSDKRWNGKHLDCKLSCNFPIFGSGELSDIDSYPDEIETKTTQAIDGIETEVTTNIQDLPRVHKGIPVINLWERYNALKLRLQNEAIIDSSNLNNKTANITNTNDCSTFWQQNNAERDVIDPKKVYESLFYGNKCLYFRGNSFIIEYDIPSKLAKNLYYGDAHYDEYQTVRKFINNMESARTDETWRQGYGLTLNLQGNVGLTQNDLCPTGQDSCLVVNTFSTPQQCENLWEALTGGLPNAINKVASTSENGVCKYTNPSIKKVIIYDSNKGKINIYQGADYYYIFPEDIVTSDDIWSAREELENQGIKLKRDIGPNSCEIYFNRLFPYGAPTYINYHEPYGPFCYITVGDESLLAIRESAALGFIAKPSNYQESSFHFYRHGYLNSSVLKRLNAELPTGGDPTQILREEYNEKCTINHYCVDFHGQPEEYFSNSFRYATYIYIYNHWYNQKTYNDFYSKNPEYLQ